MKEIILINQRHLKSSLEEFGMQVTTIDTFEEVALEIHKRKHYHKPQATAILSEMDPEGLYKNLIKYIDSQRITLPVIVLTNRHNEVLKQEAFAAGAADYFYYGLKLEKLVNRLKSLENWTTQSTKSVYQINYRMPVGKRIFDLLVSGFLLMLLSPLFLVIGLLIKLTSKGQVFYSSPRVGTGYKVFPFYKFRSMRVDADDMLKDMKQHNHYANTDQSKAPNYKQDETQPMLFSDEGYINELEVEYLKRKEEEQAFVKFQNDPRITKIGHFIRKTSIDELPQLVNVLLGHMSIVGNRPLPLYEAEKLTSDMWALRFMAPAGITGLWQVTERGKASTSADSRKLLDMIYAQNYSIWMDLKILLKTPLAAIQQEKV